MSHQTGITADEELQSFFGQHKQDHRLIKVSIKEEKLVLADSATPQGTWEDDYDAMVLPALEEKQPCYILYRLDSMNELGYEWIFLAYSPDFAPVREKMLYAATRATVKKTFGGGQIREEVFGTVPTDVSFSGYKAHVVAQSAAAPLTFAEEELKLVKETETNHHINVNSKHQTVQGVAFPISDEVLNSVERLRQGAVNYVQIRIDLENETIELDNCEDTDAESLNSRFPTDHARYHLFLYQHSHEGDYLQSLVFLYSNPEYKCPIKERMLYSSCKSTLLDALESQMHLEITKKLEVSVGSDIVNDQYLYDEVHPPKNVAKRAFDKPKGPTRKGPKRLTKPAVNE
ncbi:twinfilin-2-like [Watersipora subatra]|uniref:twinfilin-2-like n=1 Tax=Watersipora subatra TaxID=2589382 RepID=UPI00355B4230